MDVVRVLIADDEALVRHALRIFVNSAEHTTVVGEATNGAEAVERCRDLEPDVVLMDIQMPTMNGIEATAAIVEDQPCIRVIAVTTFSSERHVVAALRAGASGYLVKDTTPDMLVESIIDVHEGKSILSPQITRELIIAVRDGMNASSATVTTGPAALTERELSIVRLLAKGRSNAEIARDLHLSEATVKANFGRIMNKWSVRDRVQVLIHAVRTDLVTL